MNETPVIFGSESSLIGVISIPDRSIRPDTACLMFNAGVVSRIGPHRSNVKLARALNDAGITSLRFDLSGLGDSHRPAAVQPDFLQQTIHDLRAAMDYLERHHGIRRFFLIGNCSGAVQVYWTALADQRVVGTLMFDGFWYRTRWTLLVRHWKRFHAASWRVLANSLTRNLSLCMRRLAGRDFDMANGSALRSDSNPPRKEYCKAIQSLVDRGVAVFLVYSGGVIDGYSYAHQFRDAFANEPFVDEVRCDFIPEIDHSLLSLEAQRRFTSVVRDWVQGAITS